MSRTTLSDVNSKKQHSNVRIIRTWKNTEQNKCVIFAIPKDICRIYGIEKPSSLYLIPRKDEIALQKVDLEGIE